MTKPKQEQLGAIITRLRRWPLATDMITWWIIFEKSSLAKWGWHLQLLSSSGEGSGADQVDLSVSCKSTERDLFLSNCEFVRQWVGRSCEAVRAFRSWVRSPMQLPQADLSVCEGPGFDPGSLSRIWNGIININVTIMSLYRWQCQQVC